MMIFTMHTVYQLWHGWLTGAFIANNIFDPVPFLVWCLALLIVINLFRTQWADVFFIKPGGILL